MSRSNAGPGSITQWIATCHCSELVVQDDRVEKDPILLCTLCNKRISSGRVGSLTQWVFRSDLCRCENPSPIQATEAEVQSAVGTMMDDLTLSQEFGQAVEGLLIDEDVFPMDRYKPLREIGRGVSGIVYLSVDRMLRKHVAIKCLQTLTAKQLVAFQKEAQATSKLDHPNIIKIYDFGATENGAPYMVMEYAEGRSLADYIATHGPLPEPVALSVLTQLASALSHAHARGIFHRDVKGSNVLIVNDRTENADIEAEHLEVRVIDLGIATLKEALFQTNYGKGHTIAGTPGYMSPDQFLGKPFDARSEIYSLGCLFFEMLTGRPPYIALATIEIIHLHANEPIPLLSEVKADVWFSQVAEEIVQRCLAKDPDDRFQSMEELQAFIEDPDLPALHATQSESQAALTPVSVQEGSDRMVLPLVALVVVAICCTFGGIAYSIWQGRDTKTSTDRILRTIEGPTGLENEFEVDSALKNLSAGESRQFRITSRGPGKVGVVGADQSSSFASLKSHSGLTEVILDSCTLNASLMSELRDRKLSKLTLDVCKVNDDALNVLSDMKTLKELTVRKTAAFSGDGLKYITELPLTTISLEGIDLSDNSLKLLGRIQTLNHVTILNCPTFDEHGLTYLTDLPIKSLQLVKVTLSAAGLRSIQKMDSLNSLALKSPYFFERTGTTEDINQSLGAPTELLAPYDLVSFYGLATLKKLDTLSLDWDRMQEDHFRALKSFSKLEFLTLSGSKPMRSANWDSLADLAYLRMLRIIGPLNRIGLSKIASIRRLEHLILCDSALTDTDMSVLSNSNIEVLWILGDITLSDSGLNTIGKMPKLANLRLPRVSFITSYGLERFAKQKPSCHLVKHDL